LTEQNDTGNPPGQHPALLDRATTVAGGGDERDIPHADEALELEGPAPSSRRSPDGRCAVVAWVFRQGEAPRAAKPEELPVIITDDANVAWIDVAGYTEADLRDLGKLLTLIPAAIEATLAPWQRPRLDAFGDQLRLCATVARLETGDDGRMRVVAGELDLFVRENALVSAHRLPLPFSDRVLARASQSPDLPRLDAAYLLYAVLDELVHHTERLAEEQEDAIEDIEERALRDPGDSYLEDLLHLKRAVFALGRLVDQHREVFAAFLRPEFRLVAEREIEPYFRDLEARYSHLQTRFADAKQAVDGAFNVYVSHVAHRTNEVMRLLTVVSTVLLPAGVILGLFGTAFEGIPLYSSTAFFVMLLLISSVTGGILVAFHRRGWLGHRPE
jgi:magnesium transporter